MPPLIVLLYDSRHTIEVRYLTVTQLTNTLAFITSDVVQYGGTDGSLATA